MPTSAGPARVQRCETSIRTGAAGAVGASPQPAARISAANRKLVERLPTRSARGLRRELAHRERHGGLPVLLGRDFEAVRARARAPPGDRADAGRAEGGA